MDSKDIERERRIRYSCDVFKKRAIHEGHAATVLISTAIVSALQVQEAIKALHHLNGIALEVPVQYGMKYCYQGMNHLFMQMRIPCKDDCPSHFCAGEVVEAPLSAKDTLGAALERLGGLLGYDCVIDTYPDSAFVTTAQCVGCHKEITVNKPMADIYSDELFCPDCPPSDASGYTPQYTAVDVFGAESPFLDYTLEQLGIPPLHVLTVRAKGDNAQVAYVELTADVAAVLPNTFGRESASL